MRKKEETVKGEGKRREESSRVERRQSTERETRGSEKEEGSKCHSHKN